jgi:hypothetical protein
VPIGEGLTDVKIVRVSAGLSVLKYVSAEEAVVPPVVRVAPGNTDRPVNLIPAPGEAKDVLRAPGTAVVVVAEAESELTVTISRHSRSRSAEIELHLELLAPAVSSHIPPRRGQDRRMDASLAAADRMLVVGHLARRGDVTVESGEWLGGPEFPAPIEGVEIRWPGIPAGLELEYSVIVGGNTLRKLPPCKVNQFAGTKGRAAPIVGLTVALRGNVAGSYRIKADCLFLGEQVINQSGQRVSLAGPTGREPLVGLRLWIETMPGFRPDEASSSVPAGGLRVFRGRTPARPKRN